MNTQTSTRTRTTGLAALVAALIAGALIGLWLSPGRGYAAEHPTSSPVITWTSNRPCASEDSVDCAWNAEERGNHRGHSYIVRELPGRAHMVCVFYAERRYARHHDYCA